MKKTIHIFLFLNLLCVLVGCTSTKKIEQYIEEGKNALQNENVEEAKNFFSLALEEGESEEAEQYLTVIDLAEKFMDHTEAEDFDEAIELFEKLKEHPFYNDVAFLIMETEEKISIVIEKRKEIDEKIEGLKELYDPEVEDMMPSELYLVESEKILEEEYISKEQIQRVRDFQKAAKEQAEKLFKQMDEEKERIEREEQRKLEQQPKKKLSVEEAKEMLYDYLVTYVYSKEALSHPDVYFDFDHENEDGNYIFQVYEVVFTDDIGHTATWGWFGVDPDTHEIYNAMEF